MATSHLEKCIMIITKSDAIRIISVIVTFFVAVPILAVLFGATGFIVVVH